MKVLNLFGMRYKMGERLSRERRMLESIRKHVNEAETASDLGDEVDWEGMEYLDIELTDDKLDLHRLKSIIEDNLSVLRDKAYNVDFEKDSIPLERPRDTEDDKEFDKVAFFDVYEGPVTGPDAIRVATGEAQFNGVWPGWADHPTLDSVRITRYKELSDNVSESDDGEFCTLDTNKVTDMDTYRAMVPGKLARYKVWKSRMDKLTFDDRPPGSIVIGPGEDRYALAFGEMMTYHGYDGHKYKGWFYSEDNYGYFKVKIGPE
jgi:hypothetical protein